MAKQTKARLDQKGLSDLGLEKLIEILLDEAATNKPLKSRLLSALAGMSGPDGVARLIDVRLDTLEKAKSGLSSNKARELAVELQGLVRNIVSELAALDSGIAADRLLRFMEVACLVQERLYEDSSRLRKVFDGAGESVVDLLAKLDPEQQIRVVPRFERLRKADDYRLFVDPLMNVAQKLHPHAVEAWKALLLEEIKKPRSKKEEWRPNTAVDFLQQLALSANDIDAYIKYEATKPQTFQNSFRIAELLYEAKRYTDALDWVRREDKGVRIISVGNMVGAVLGGVPGYEQRRLEADILDGLKRRDEAQAVRWKEFERTLSVVALRAYIAKLDDFAEFDELDKAFDAVRKSPNIYQALVFFIGWPKLDMAASHVMRHAGKWQGQSYYGLAEAADVLSPDYPIAATLLYRLLLKTILDRGESVAYTHGATYLAAMSDIKARLPHELPFVSHDEFIDEIRRKHGRKYGFWQLIPGEMK